MTKRDEYVNKMKAQIDGLNAQVDVLQAKAREAKSDAREKYETEMAKLREQSKKAGDKLKELKNAGEDTWEKLVAEMDKVRDAFVHSFNYFKSQLK
jgi:predicted  nucleic acid-binding Zn-ribbon protein